MGEMQWWPMTKWRKYVRKQIDWSWDAVINVWMAWWTCMVMMKKSWKRVGRGNWEFLENYKLRNALTKRSESMLIRYHLIYLNYDYSTI